MNCAGVGDRQSREFAESEFVPLDQTACAWVHLADRLRRIRVSVSNLARVKKYIRNQEAHHRKMTFEQEFLALLKKHGVDYDPKHVFH